jgi:hypothetical protein
MCQSLQNFSKTTANFLLKWTLYFTRDSEPGTANQTYAVEQTGKPCFLLTLERLSEPFYLLGKGRAQCSRRKRSNDATGPTPKCSNPETASDGLQFNQAKLSSSFYKAGPPTDLQTTRDCEGRAPCLSFQLITPNQPGEITLSTSRKITSNVLHTKLTQASKLVTSKIQASKELKKKTHERTAKPRIPARLPETKQNERTYRQTASTEITRRLDQPQEIKAKTQDVRANRNN